MAAKKTAKPAGKKAAPRAVAKRAPKAAKKPSDAPAAAPKGVLTRTATKKAAPKPAASAAAPAKGATGKAKSIPPGPGAPGERVLFPKDVYEANKDAIKAPLKAQGYAWQYLGEGKGRYHKDHAAIFVQFTDEGTDYHVRAKDPAMIEALTREWKGIVGARSFEAAQAKAEEAAAAEAAQAESEAVRLWKLAEPQPRAGEPASFYQKRLAEWNARKPA